jgi:ribosomal protein S18 acetylase RimI-like enzyme
MASRGHVGAKATVRRGVSRGEISTRVRDAAAGVNVVIRRLGRGDIKVLDTVAPDVFDGEVDRASAVEFLGDRRHHLVVAIVRGQVVGFASGVHYVHPDKPASMFINEVGVARQHQRAGIGRKMLDHLLAHARAIGCEQAWVATAADNLAARALYAAAAGELDRQVFVTYTFMLTASRDAGLR